MRATLLLAATTLSTGCVGTAFTEAACHTVEKDVAGDLRQDAVGTWEGYGIDSRLVYVIGDDGSLRFIEPPNVYAPEGLEDEGTWSVVEEDQLVVTWSSGDAATWTAEVTESNLLLTTASEFEGETWTDTWSRVCCTGSPKPCL